MLGFIQCLHEQARLHPSMMPQDVVKLCYQAAFGAEHMLCDTERARKYFSEEYACVVPKKEPLYEMLSESVCRINMREWKRSDMPSEWLFNMFLLSAKNFRRGDIEEYFSAAGSAELPFSSDEWERFLEKYRLGGIRAVHHSDRYRENEAPSYRIVGAEYVGILDILKKISELKNKCVVAIDGRAAAGKTTLAEKLGSVMNAPVIHMDDFFLPPELRTQERFSEAGGNIHYERFAKEVLPHLASKDGFEYRIFDCGLMNYGGAKKIPESDIYIVEGAYSFHPRFGNYADLKIFCDVDADVQMNRITKRNGEEMAEKFKSIWIPLEEKYFDRYAVGEKADVVKYLNYN